MKELNKYYVTPRIEVYELENESFIASSSDIQRNPVGFGGGDGGGWTGGWTIQKGGNNGAAETPEVL